MCWRQNSNRQAGGVRVGEGTFVSNFKTVMKSHVMCRDEARPHAQKIPLTSFPKQDKHWCLPLAEKPYEGTDGSSLHRLRNSSLHLSSSISLVDFPQQHPSVVLPDLVLDVDASLSFSHRHTQQQQNARLLLRPQQSMCIQ